jgi:uncharacterized membrane protein HdeD (DUF308 family)
MSTGMDAALDPALDPDRSDPANRDQSFPAASLGSIPAAGLGASPARIQDRWWTVLVRGLAAIAFGVVTLVAPRTSLVILAVAFGVYAIVDALVHLFAANRWPPEARTWTVFQGLLSLAAGIVALAWPGLTAMGLVLVIALWAALVGVAQIAVSLQLRQGLHGAWLLATAGMLSIALAVALFVAPAAGVTLMLWLIGLYALVLGLLLVGVGVRLRTTGGGGPGDRPVGVLGGSGAQPA